MIYVTGDVHGDLGRFKGKAVARKLKKGDYLIVCGDLGFFWNDSREERKARKWLSRRKYTILFVEGTHDNLVEAQGKYQALWEAQAQYYQKSEE